jgi:hypothetical protein
VFGRIFCFTGNRPQKGRLSFVSGVITEISKTGNSSLRALGRIYSRGSSPPTEPLRDPKGTFSNHFGLQPDSEQDSELLFRVPAAVCVGVGQCYLGTKVRFAFSSFTLSENNQDSCWASLNAPGAEGEEKVRGGC